jgi:ribosome-binding ATPase YchF (GTP1/OBG family)
VEVKQMTTFEIPEHVAHKLLPSENVLAVATESSIKSTGNLNSIIATNKRLILVEPVLNASTHAICDVQYSDIEKIIHKTGRFFSQIWLITQNGQKYNLDRLEKYEAHNVADAAQKMRSESGNHRLHSIRRDAA